MYRVVILRVQGKRHLLAHCVYFYVIEPRGRYVCSFMCIKVVCVVCGLCSIATGFRHCAKLRLIQSRRRRICAFLNAKEADTMQEWCIVDTCIAWIKKVIVRGHTIRWQGMMFVGGAD